MDAVPLVRILSNATAQADECDSRMYVQVTREDISVDEITETLGGRLPERGVREPGNVGWTRQATSA
ncbi:hypothetical protein MRX96_004583 [Rhipicephalus microplus]